MTSSQSSLVHLSDPARLAALNRFAIMDSGPDPAFDELARLAALVCMTPVAFISFVDGRRQSVKSCVGTVIEDCGVEDSVCAALVDRKQSIVIRDIREHPRFSAIAGSRREPAIVFYAAMVLCTDDGHAIGTLCVADTRPRELTSAQAEGLQIVSKQIMARLELRHALLAAQSAESGHMRVAAEAVNRLKLAVEAGHLGDWQWKQGTDTVMLSARALELFGVDAQPDQWLARSSLMALIDQAHRDRISTALADSLRTGGTYDTEYPVERFDGRTLWLAARGRVTYGPDGAVDGMIGVIQDITDRKHGEAQLKQTARRLAVLAEMSAIAGRAVDPDEMVTGVVALVAQALGADGGGIAEISDGRIVPSAGFALPSRSRTDDESADDVGAGSASRESGDIMPRWLVDLDRSRGTLVIDDHARSCDLAAADGTKAPGGEGVGARTIDGDGPVWASWLCVPLLRDGDVRGVLEFHDHRHRRWGDDEIELAEASAERLWLLLDKARADQAIRAGERKFRMAADMTPQLAWMARPDGTMFWFNQRWREYTDGGDSAGDESGSLGYASHHASADDVHSIAQVSVDWLRHVDPEQRDEVSERFRQTLGSGADRLEDTVSLVRHDGAVRGHLARALPLRDDAGRNVLWFGTFTDLTEQLELAAERERLLDAERAAREQAEYTSRMKDEFLATLSHELRTPLTAILGWSQVLMRLPSPSQVHADGVAAIDRNARNQAQIIEDLLDMSRIIAGRLRLEPKLQPIGSILESALQGIRPTASAKGVRLALTVDDDLPELAVDEGRLAQVLWNLLSNAVKFTPAAGLVTLAAFANRDSAGTPRAVVIRVSDTGEGIDPAFLPHLFGRFTQADGTRTRNAGGLGLGLAIVKQLAELHGGCIDVSSAGRGQGATFDVWLPAAASGEATSVEAGAVDDDGRERSPSVPARHRDSTTVAHPAPHAGPERRRTKPDRFGSEPVTPASSQASPAADDPTNERGHGPRRLEPGPCQGNGTTRLPTSAAEPVPGIESVAGAEPRGPVRAGRLAGRCILVVDDQDDNRMVLQRLIEHHGASVLLAGAAEQAYALLREYRPDLMVSDIGMPGEDGYALMRRIRDLPPADGGRTPAIALTAYARPEDRVRTLEVGYQAHVPKPVDPGKLMTAIGALLPPS